MVSMKDIASKCGVSVATVSKALNGYSDIGKKKREEIQAVAKEMGVEVSSKATKTETVTRFRCIPWRSISNIAWIRKKISAELTVSSALLLLKHPHQRIHTIPHMVDRAVTIQVHCDLYLRMSQNIAERFDRDAYFDRPCCKRMAQAMEIGVFNSDGSVQKSASNCYLISWR